jgi:hypothetical protein
MRKMVVLIAVCSTCFAGAVNVKAQTNEAGSSFRAMLSDRPFFRTQSVLTLSGDYVNTPKEDFEQLGMWNLPLTLDQMDGLIAGVAFGDGEQEGQWQLAYRHKLATMDTSWQAIADASSGLTLSDRRSQVLKANYNVRSWWRLGIAAFVEDRFGDDTGIDPVPLIPNSHQSIGFQIDTTLKF